MDYAQWQQFLATALTDPRIAYCLQTSAGQRRLATVSGCWQCYAQEAQEDPQLAMKMLRIALCGHSLITPDSGEECWCSYIRELANNWADYWEADPPSPPPPPAVAQNYCDLLWQYPPLKAECIKMAASGAKLPELGSGPTYPTAGGTEPEVPPTPPTPTPPGTTPPAVEEDSSTAKWLLGGAGTLAVLYLLFK